MISQGGVDSKYSDVVSRYCLAAMGAYSYGRLPAVPLELVYRMRHRWHYGNAAIIGIGLVSALRESLDDDVLDVSEVDLGAQMNLRRWVFRILKAILRLYNRLVPASVRRQTIFDSARFLTTVQDESGVFYGNQPGTVFAIMGLQAVLHYIEREGLIEDPEWEVLYSEINQTIRAAIRGLKATSFEESDDLYQPACMMALMESRIWDTAESLEAIRILYGPDSMEAQRMKDFLESSFSEDPYFVTMEDPELRGKIGGWSFQSGAVLLPDTDSTARVLKATQGMGLEQRIIRQALGFIEHLQGPNGGHGVVIKPVKRDITARLMKLQKIWDMAVYQEETIDLTVRILEMLGMHGYTAADPTVRKALDYLLENWREDGYMPTVWAFGAEQGGL